MKKLSIKMKVTLWYTIILVLIVVIVMTILLMISNYQILSTARLRMEQVVNESMEKIEYEENTLKIDNGLNYFEDGIYLSIYDQDARFLYGRIPKNFDNQIGLYDKELQEIEQDNKKWFIYDSMEEIEGVGEIWIRSIMPQAEVTSAIQYMVQMIFIIIPFLVIAAAGTGYYLTKRAFRPIKQINDTARKITIENDLSKRICLGEGKDEVYQLAGTFDDMLSRLEEAFEKERQFTSDASHELRTPTSVIISESEYALENAETRAEMKESMQVVLTNAQKMAGLISQLLMFARADQNRQKLNIEEVNLSELVELIIEDQKELARNKNIHIKSQIGENIIFFADETMIMRLFINLISNAVKYGRENGSIAVNVTSQDVMITGYVEDNGIGIEARNIDKIWDRFYQADTSRASEDGMGLGLSMVKWIVEAHGGTITVESVIDKGSKFTFEIPMKNSDKF